MALHIQLLGDFQILDQGQPVQGLRSRRMQTLLAYLLLHRHAPQSRQRIAFLFWPDTSEAQARANLRNLLHRLRETWPESQAYLDISPHTLLWRISPDCQLDVADFESRLAQAEAAAHESDAIHHLRAVVELYQGDLLPDMYDEWLAPERSRLRQAYLLTLERVVTLLEDGRDYQTAIHYAHRMLNAEPLSEAAHRQLMRLHMLARDRAGALRAYHACATILQNELGVEPSAATCQVYEQILHSPDQPPVKQAVPSASPLIGRQAQWKRLTSIGRHLAAGRVPPQAILIRGEAGIGKTRLAKEFIDWAHRQGSTTIWATCYAAEANLPYAPAIRCLRSISFTGLESVWQVEIGRLLPELLGETEQNQPGLTEPWQRQRLFEAMARALLTQKQPIVIALDDLQWCDKETLTWLHYLFRFDQRARLMFLGTIRSEELVDQQFLARLAPALQQSEQWSDIRLPRLDEQETGQLAAHLTHRQFASSDVSALYHSTEGNPLFIVETVRAGLDTLPVDPASPGHPQAPATPVIASVLANRLEQLSPTARWVVDLAAVIGREFRFEVLEQAAQWDEELLMQGLDELWQRRIVRDQGIEAYDFSHDRLRQFAYASLNPARRWQLHRRVAHALEALHANDLEAVSGLIAGHYAAGGNPGKAALYYHLAAAAAQKIFAHQEATHHLQQALALLQKAPRDLQFEDLLHAQLGDTLAVTGQHAAAREAYCIIFSRPADLHPIESAQAARKSGNSWRFQARYAEAWQDYQTAECLLGPEPATPDPAWWQAWLDVQIDKLELLYFQDRLEEMAKLCESVRTLVATHGTARQQAGWYASLGKMENRQWRFRTSGRSVHYARQALELIRTTGDSHEIATAEFGVGFSLLWSGDLPGGRQWIMTAMTNAERSGNLPILDRCLAYLTIISRLEGNLPEAEALARRSLSVSTATGNASYIGVAKANLAWLSYRAGDLEAASDNALAALKHWSKFTYPLQWLSLWPLLGISLQRRELGTAIEHARALLHPGQQALPADFEETLIVAAAAWDARDPATAQIHLEAALKLAKSSGHL